MPQEGNVLTRTLDKGKDIYGKFFDPNRNVLSTAELAAKPEFKQLTDLGFSAKEALAEVAKSNQPSFLSKYGPLALAGTAVAGAAGAFETPEENIDASPFGTTSQELFAANPARYSVFAGFRKPTAISSAQVPSSQLSEYIYKNYLPRQAAAGGIMNRQGQDFPRRQGFISGPGTETSDDIPAMLSDGEFVMTARAVRGAGNGSREKGVRKMYDMMRAFEGGAVA